MADLIASTGPRSAARHRPAHRAPRERDVQLHLLMLGLGALLMFGLFLGTGGMW
ncbi:hypothetical protein [Pseudonocardia sp. NPDC049635]|uniref:hypothetical protein n=1 Tax=Pseudonocardia sp. NPDC049635 TaxID=3155506 RepID=UPI00340C7382